MDINVNGRIVFGMKAMTSLRQYARNNPDKVMKIDPVKMKKANDTIKKALKGSQNEQAKARESASKIILTI